MSRTHTADDTATAPLWMGSVSRNGRAFGFRYQINAIDEDFRAAAGFISRAGIVRAAADHRVDALRRRKAAWWERATGNVMVDGDLAVRRFRRRPARPGPADARDRQRHASRRLGRGRDGDDRVVRLRRRALRRLPARTARRPTVRTSTLPFVGHATSAQPRLADHGQHAAVETVVGGRCSTCGARTRTSTSGRRRTSCSRSTASTGVPTEQIRVNGGFQLQQYKRRTDRTIVGQRKIPRLKLEYQLSRAIFFRFVGEYDAYRQDDLRDDSRTDLPIFLFDRVCGHVRACAGLHARTSSGRTGCSRTSRCRAPSCSPVTAARCPRGMRCGSAAWPASATASS